MLKRFKEKYSSLEKEFDQDLFEEFLVDLGLWMSILGTDPEEEFPICEGSWVAPSYICPEDIPRYGNILKSAGSWVSKKNVSSKEYERLFLLLKKTLEEIGRNW